MDPSTSDSEPELRGGELVSAAQMFHDAGDDCELKLEAILHAVVGAKAILEEEFYSDTLAPLQYLVAALSRLQVGRDDPVISRQHKGQPGQRNCDGSIIFKQVNVLFAVEILVRAGSSKKDAFNRVAGLTSALGWSGPDGRLITQNMIKNWDWAVRNAKPGFETVCLELRPQVEHIGRMTKEDADRAVRLLLRQATAFEGIVVSD